MVSSLTGRDMLLRRIISLLQHRPYVAGRMAADAAGNVVNPVSALADPTVALSLRGAIIAVAGRGAPGMIHELGIVSRFEPKTKREAMLFLQSHMSRVGERK